MHIGHTQAAHLPGSKDIDIVDTPHIVEVDLERIFASATAEARIIDKDIHCAESLYGHIDGLLQVVVNLHIALHGNSLATVGQNLIYNGLSLRKRAVAHHHFCPGCRQYLGAATPNTVAATGDYRHLSF